MSRDIIGDKVRREADAARSLIAELSQSHDDDELLHDMVEGETDLFEAIEKALDEIRTCQANIIGIEEKVAMMNKRKARHKNRGQTLRGLIEQAMIIAEVESHAFTCETLTIKRTPPKPIIDDESKIPSAYWKPQPPALDKVRLNEAAKKGPVDGVAMSNGGITLAIRST